MAVALLVTPFAFLGEVMARRRIVYRGAWWRAARRGALAGLVIAALAGLRLGDVLSVPIAIFVVILAGVMEWFFARRDRLTEAPMTDVPPSTDATVAGDARGTRPVAPRPRQPGDRLRGAPGAAWTAELLERHGFEVIAPAGGLETAFVARRPGSGRAR